MKAFIFPSVVLIGLSLSALSASAEMRDDINPTGPYVGVGVGQFNLRIKHLNDVDNAVSSINNSDDNAWKAFVGYRFMPYLSVEAAYSDFGRPNDTFTATGSNGNYRVDLSGFSPSIVGHVPLGPIELFAKAGEYYYDVHTRVNFDSPGPGIDTKHSRNDFLWGGGISGVIFHHVELRAEYEKVEIQNARDSDAFWLSAAWRF